MQVVRGWRCPLCKNSVLPLDLGMSSLIEQVRQVFGGSQWANVIDSLLPKAGSPLLKGPTVDWREAPPTFPLNAPQPNTRHAPNLPSSLQEDASAWFTQMNRRMKAAMTQHRSLDTSTRSMGRVLLNCVALRNVRWLSRGVSPRQVVVVLLGMLLIGVMVVWVMPAVALPKMASA